MAIFSNKLKKKCFWLVLGPFSFPILGAKKTFPENPTLSRTTSHGILTPFQISEKTNDRIPRKHLDRRTDGRRDRHYFIGPFRLPPRAQKLLFVRDQYFAKHR